MRVLCKYCDEKDMVESPLPNGRIHGKVTKVSEFECPICGNKVVVEVLKE